MCVSDGESLFCGPLFEPLSSWVLFVEAVDADGYLVVVVFSAADLGVEITSAYYSASLFSRFVDGAAEGGIRGLYEMVTVCAMREVCSDDVVVCSM